MGWDIMVGDFPKDAATPTDLPDGYSLPSMGKRSEIIRKIQEIIPAVKFVSLSYGDIEGEDWSVEVDLDQGSGNDPNADVECEMFWLIIRGTGETSVGIVAAILKHLDIRGIDCQTTEFFDAGPNTAESFQKWRDFLGQVRDQYPI